MDTPIASLTETQLLSEVRKAFAGESLNDIDLEALIEQSVTLQELVAGISAIVATRNNNTKQ